MIIRGAVRATRGWSWELLPIFLKNFPFSLLSDYESMVCHLLCNSGNTRAWYDLASSSVLKRFCLPHNKLNKNVVPYVNVYNATFRLFSELQSRNSQQWARLVHFQDEKVLRNLIYDNSHHLSCWFSNFYNITDIFSWFSVFGSALTVMFFPTSFSSTIII